VTFNEVGGTSRIEEAQMEKEREKIVFELRNKDHDSNELTKSYEEVEQVTLVVRRYERVRKLVERYSLCDFHSTFVLFSIDK
jgi:hypothetical protein